MSKYVECWSAAEQKLMIECQRLQALSDNKSGQIQKLKLALAERDRALFAQRKQIQLMEKMNKNLVKALGAKVTTISRPKKAAKKAAKKAKSTGESKTGSKKSNAAQEKIKKDIQKAIGRIKSKSDNTVHFNETPSYLVNKDMKTLKAYLARCNKIEKITDIVIAHKKEMAKRGVQSCEYDIGCIMSRFPTLKVGEIRQYLKKDLPRQRKKPAKKSIITQLREHGRD